MSKAVSKRDRLPNFSNYDSFRIHSIKTGIPKLLRKLQSNVFNIRWTISLYSLCHDCSSVYYELPALDVLVHVVLVPALVLAVGAAPPPGQLHHLRHDLRVQCWEYQAFIWTSSNDFGLREMQDNKCYIIERQFKLRLYHLRCDLHVKCLAFNRQSNIGQ